MHKTRISFLVVALLLVLGLALAASGASTASDTELINIKVILSENNGENSIEYYFRLSKDSNYTLLELMERKFVVEHENGFITSIQGKAALNADQTAWMYDINFEMALVGASQYKIKDGDVYHWDLRKW